MSKDLPSGRRRFLQRSAVLGAAAAGAATAARAEPLTVPSWTRTPGEPVLWRPYGQPSPFEKDVVRRSRSAAPLPGANSSMTPLQDLHGIITPTGLVFERHHAGIPQIDPAQHRLAVHGLVARPRIFTMDELVRLPSLSRIYFLECSGNTGREWKAPGAKSVQISHGLLSCCEWTGVPLSVVLDEAGVAPDAAWVLAEGADGAAMSRSVPLAKAMEDALLVYAQNGEMLRPEHGYPLRLFLPGYEGNMSIKWLRRLKLGREPFMSREETAKYTDSLPDGSARQFTFLMDVKSVITFPAPDHKLRERGFYEISGLAWSGHGRILVSTCRSTAAAAGARRSCRSRCWTAPWCASGCHGAGTAGRPRWKAAPSTRRAMCNPRPTSWWRRAASPRPITTTRSNAGAWPRTGALPMRVLKTFGAGMLALACVAAAMPAVAQTYGLGRAASERDLAPWNIDVAPDGTGLPPGSGSVALGQQVYAQHCAACHGANGEGKPADALVGGQGTLKGSDPVKTIGSFWPYATTVFDFINRAMPYNAPQSLAPDEVYAVTAWLLHKNGIVPADTVLDARTLPQVKMPNRDGFVADARPDTANVPCRSGCKGKP